MPQSKTQKDKEQTEIELSALSMSARFMPETINEKDRTIKVQYTAGASVLRYDYWKDKRYYEELSLAKGDVRLGRMNGGAAPVLNSHRGYDLDDVIGTVIEADETHATIKLSAVESVREIWEKIKEGVLRNISVGYSVYRYEDVTEEDNDITVLRAVDWEPFEVSFVAIPADAGAGVRNLADQKNKCIIESTRTEKLETKKDQTMPETKKDALRDNETVADVADTTVEPAVEDETPTEAVEETADETVVDGERSADEIRAEGAIIERQRVADIKDLFRGLDIDDTMADNLIKSGESIEQARAIVVEQMKRKDDMTDTRTGTQDVSISDNQTRNQSIENALLHRSNPSKHALEGDADRYRGMSLLDVARSLIGYKECEGLSKMEVAKRAMHSSSDFPEILANVANKSLRQAYNDTKRSFIPFSRQITLPDFKEAKRTALSNASSLTEVVEGGEYKHGQFTDGAETIQLGTYGTIIAITRQAIINDDLDAFTRVPAKMAAAAARLEVRMVYNVLKTNPLMNDGFALFSNDHANLTNKNLGVDGIGKMRELMRLQKDPSGEDNLNIEPRYLVVPAALETAAAKLKASITPDQTGNANPFSSTFDIIVDGQLDADSALNYYMIADPSEVDTIEYAYLDGQVGPYLESRDGFTVDGVEFKVRHDFAVKAIDHRGLAKSTNNE